MMVIGLFGAAVFAVAPLFVAGPLAFVRDPPARRPVRLDLRPGRARLPRRRQPARATGRDVRAVRGRADGRPDPRTGDRRPGRGRDAQPDDPVLGRGHLRVPVGRPRLGARPRRAPDGPRCRAGRGGVRRRGGRGEDADVAADPPAQPGPRSRRSSSTSAATSPSGAYEVVWSLYLGVARRRPRADRPHRSSRSPCPILLLSPVMGRFIDHEGGFLALVLGIAGSACAARSTPPSRTCGGSSRLGLVEGTAFAVAPPALFLLVARSSPDRPELDRPGPVRGGGHDRDDRRLAERRVHGRRSTSGCRSSRRRSALARCSSSGLLIGRRRLYDAMQPTRLAAPPRPVAVATPRRRRPPLTDRAIDGSLAVAGWSSGSSSGS